MPQRNDSRKDNARVQAEKFRNDLGIIDDIYDLYVDTVKRQKHEAEIPEILEGGISFPLSASPSSAKMSRTQRRVARERARKQAVGQGSEEMISPAKAQARAKTAQTLESQTPNSRANDVDFTRWLELMAKQDLCQDKFGIDVLNSSGQHQITPVMANNEICVAGQRLSEIPEESEQPLLLTRRKNSGQEGTWSYQTERDEEEPEVLVPVANKELSSLRDTNSSISLTQLREHLQALMDDDQSIPQPVTQELSLAQQPLFFSTDGLKQSPHLSNSPKASSSPQQSTEYGPMDLQRIEIEWKGKRYPVLIGEHGKLWEAPCRDPNCVDHGRRWEALMGNIFE